MFLFAVFGGSLVACGSSYNTPKSIINLDNVKILVLIADGFGDPYFYAKELLESWGCSITTAGLTDDPMSCPNKPQRPVASDILISEIDRDVISGFDCVFIPPGASHLHLQNDQDTLDLIAMAYEEGLVIATMCVSLVVLAKANDIASGVKVVGHTNANFFLEEAGAIIVGDAIVVSDSRIITSTRMPGESLLSLTHQTCRAMIKESLGYSYVHRTTVESSSGESGTTYTINVEITDSFESLMGISSLNITKVTANIFSEKTASSLETIELADDDHDDIYSGNFTGSKNPNYHVDIEIKDCNGTLEVLRNAASISEDEESAPGYESLIAIIGLALLAFPEIRRRAKNRNFKQK